MRSTEAQLVECLRLEAKVVNEFKTDRRLCVVSLNKALNYPQLSTVLPRKTVNHADMTEKLLTGT